MADLDAALAKDILDTAEQQREPDIEYRGDEEDQIIRCKKTCSASLKRRSSYITPCPKSYSVTPLDCRWGL